MPYNPNSPTLTHILQTMLDARLASVFTWLPGRIVSLTGNPNSVNVKPIIDQPIIDEKGERQIESLPIIEDVALIFPGSGGVRIRFPIGVGDYVVLLFSSSSIDRWITTAQEGDPQDDRHHALSDAIAIPGLLPLIQNPGNADIQLEFTSSEIQAGGTQGLVTINEFNAHVHSGVTTGPGTSGPPAPPALGTQILKGA